MPKSSFAPQQVFEEILKYMPIATFDLIIQYGSQGVIVCKRKIAPYKNVWALPGLRMYKGESIDDVLVRIAKQEVGLKIKVEKKQFIGQYVGKFKTENNRQDISTAYLVKACGSQRILINPSHFSSFKVVEKIPSRMGAMYEYYLRLYFDDVAGR